MIAATKRTIAAPVVNQVAIGLITESVKGKLVGSPKTEPCAFRIVIINPDGSETMALARN